MGQPQGMLANVEQGGSCGCGGGGGISSISSSEDESDPEDVIAGVYMP